MYWLPKLNFGIVGRLKDKAERDACIEAGESPRYGFYYWMWLPAMYWNHGRFRMGEVIDINFGWFCFFGSLTFWPGKPLIQNISRGMCIPWGLSWYREMIFDDLGNCSHASQRQLVFCIRLPFYWRKKIPWEHNSAPADLSEYVNSYNEETFGGAVLRIRFWDDFNIFWVPDYQFAESMINQPERGQ